MASQAVLKAEDRPNIFAYTDLHDFLIETLDYFSLTEKKFSLRKLAMKTGVDHGQISRILKRQTTLTESTLEKIAPELKLSQDEINFLFALRGLSESRTQEERISAFKKVLRFRSFKALNSKDLIQHEYLSNWYYPVIRELAKIPGFRLDPKWIRKQLGKKITASEIQLAINFLLQHGYLNLLDDGSVEVTQTQITCVGGIYRLAATEYHEQLLSLARDSIYDVNRDLRELFTHTLAMPEDKIYEIKDIIQNAVTEIRNVQMDHKKKNAVYQISFLAFPVAKLTESEGEK